MPNGANLAGIQITMRNISILSFIDFMDFVGFDCLGSIITNHVDAGIFCCILFHSIDGSVVECSPATRAARVRFPVDAVAFLHFSTVFIKS